MAERQTPRDNWCGRVRVRPVSHGPRSGSWSRPTWGKRGYLVDVAGGGSGLAQRRHVIVTQCRPVTWGCCHVLSPRCGGSVADSREHPEGSPKPGRRSREGQGASGGSLQPRASGPSMSTASDQRFTAQRVLSSGISNTDSPHGVRMSRTRCPLWRNSLIE